MLQNLLLKFPLNKTNNKSSTMNMYKIFIELS